MSVKDCTRFYIGGKWVVPDSARTTIEVENPATRQVIGRVLQAEHEDVDRAVAAARAAFENWSQSSREDRLVLLDRVIEVYRRRQDELAAVMTAEMGSSKKLADSEQAPSGLGHLEAARAALESYAFESDDGKGTTVRREPVGVCAFITPWNWPMNQVAAKVAPALATGCTCVLKPSEISPLSAHLFAEILDAAGVP
ncbi:MAG: aldehyde dehydrogenase family protein, partial [Halofilum sp. (in: g-proteobacteria)]|nr:aldehyde dehydrogenase family protein [Halofilum sp. (in: g-proteobacteria)]